MDNRLTTFTNKRNSRYHRNQAVIRGSLHRRPSLVASVSPSGNASRRRVSATADSVPVVSSLSPLSPSPLALFPRTPGRPKSIIRQNRHTDFSEIKDQHRLVADNAVRACRRRGPPEPAGARPGRPARAVAVYNRREMSRGKNTTIKHAMLDKPNKKFNQNGTECRRPPNLTLLRGAVFRGASRSWE